MYNAQYMGCDAIENYGFLPPTGLEPAIPGLEGRCLIHWATEACIFYSKHFFRVPQSV